MTSELNQLISEELDLGKKEILKKLKLLCKWAYIQMSGYGKSWKQKYNSLWKKKEWKEARLLLKEYFTIRGVLTCPECSKEIKEGQSFTLHHKDFYGKSFTFFNPMYCSIIHSKCHKRGNPRK